MNNINAFLYLNQIFPFWTDEREREREREEGIRKFHPRCSLYLNILFRCKYFSYRRRIQIRSMQDPVVQTQTKFWTVRKKYFTKITNWKSLCCLSLLSTVYLLCIVETACHRKFPNFVMIVIFRYLGENPELNALLKMPTFVTVNVRWLRGKTREHWIQVCLGFEWLMKFSWKHTRVGSEVGVKFLDKISAEMEI